MARVTDPNGGSSTQTLPPAPPLDVSQRQTERTMPSGASVPTGGPSGTSAQDALIAQLQAQLAALSGRYSSLSGGSGSAAADLAEKQREFDVTTQRDIAKQNATEVDALQKMLAGLSGPKDVYADLFFSHGLNVPQGYQPAPVPLTDAQKAAYAGMGVTPQQLQQMIVGTGKPGADTGYLGNLGSSLQPQPGQPGYQSVQAPAGPQQASNPTVQGGQLYGQAPPGSTVTGVAAPATPAMAVGGQVPGPTGDPRLVVAHGGEQVDNDTDQGQLAPINNTGVHPAIQKLMDALSGLLADPDFQQFAGIAGKAAAISKPPAKGSASKSKGAKQGSANPAPEGPMQGPMAQMAPGPAVTPGGIQSMATGGAVSGGGGGGLTPAQTLSYQQSGRNPGLNPAPPISPSPVPTNVGRPAAGGSGLGSVSPVTPQASPPVFGQGAQGIISNTGAAQPADNPIMPLNKMDPYTRALYDVHGRLHPYSAQQEQQMGPAGTAAVGSYVGKVEGADINAYNDLVNRLKPIGAAPTASTGSATEGFTFG